MKINDMQDLLHHQISDLLSAENQIIEALPKMISGASDAKLKKGLNDHLKETKNQVKRLEQCFEILGKKPGREKCKGMAGLLEEGEKALEDIEDNEVLDAAIIGSCQKVEHYEIAGYGTARTHAQTCGMNEIADLLQETLDEEGQADKLLTQIAESRVNEKAAS